MQLFAMKGLIMKQEKKTNDHLTKFLRELFSIYPELQSVKNIRVSGDGDVLEFEVWETNPPRPAKTPPQAPTIDSDKL